MPGRALSKPSTLAGRLITLTAIGIAVFLPLFFEDMIDRIDFRATLLPPIAGSALVLSIPDVAAMILCESTPGFIAIGGAPDTPSQGSIMADGKNDIATSWGITGRPGLVILVTILGLDLLAIGLRQTLAEARER